MERAAWVSLLQKRFTVKPADHDSKPGETTYHIKDKQVQVIVRSAVPSGSLKAESLTDSEECLIVNRGQSRYAFIDWNQVEIITTVDT